MYNTMPVNDEAVKRAFQVFQAFIDVTRAIDHEEQVDALKTHCLSLNLDEEVIETMWAESEDMFGEAPAGFIFIGVLIGLRAAEHALNGS